MKYEFCGIRRLENNKHFSLSFSPLFVWNWPEMLLKLIYTVNESIHLLPTIPSCCKAKKRCFCQAADKNLEAETGEKKSNTTESSTQNLILRQENVIWGESKAWINI